VGHTKGILAYYQNQAIYIVHSFDTFPSVLPNGQGNFYAVGLDILDPQMEYGQHMFCVTLSTTDLFSLAGVMSINNPQVYYSRINTPNTNITLLVQNRTISAAKSYYFNFYTGAGMKMTYFSKSASANVDLYEAIVSPHFADGMILQTWGRPYEADFCPPTYQYKNLNVYDVTIGTYYWPGTNDHSKWGVGISTQLLCYGDINRMTSQWTRGGGTLCTLVSPLQKLQKSFVESYGSC
jgi:deoxyribonuclease II